MTNVPASLNNLKTKMANLDVDKLKKNYSCRLERIK